jgi:hypothetical protein
LPSLWERAGRAVADCDAKALVIAQANAGAAGKAIADAVASQEIFILDQAHAYASNNLLAKTLT